MGFGDEQTEARLLLWDRHRAEVGDGNSLPGEVREAPVVGREHELAVLRSFVEARRGPAALVLEGDAGIGKTTLWEAGLAIARAADQRVLRCRPAAAESQLSFAAVADLLAEMLD